MSLIRDSGARLDGRLTNDAARSSFNGCLTKPNRGEFQACYNAIMSVCGNWR